MTTGQYRNRETGEIITIKGFGSRLKSENSWEMTTMIWIKPKSKEETKFISEEEFYKNYELIKNL